MKPPNWTPHEKKEKFTGRINCLPDASENKGQQFSRKASRFEVTVSKVKVFEIIQAVWETRCLCPSI